MTIIAFIIIFSIVVIAHEFGHFLIAKINGISVSEFSVGMGPKLLKFQKKETTYVLRLLPIGGACIFTEADGLEAKEGGTGKVEGSMQDANVWVRISSVVAGPLFNILLAFLLSLIVVSFAGTDVPVLGAVTEGSPAYEAGIRPGDTILEVNDEKIHLFREISLISFLNRGEPLEVVYSRDGIKQTANLVPAYSEAEGRYLMGFSGGAYVESKGASVFVNSYYEVRYWLKSTFKSLGMLVQGKVTKDDVAGPIGIAMVVDETIEVSKSYGMLTVIINMMNIAILLSVNLGVLNLLPIPALDGGRLVFLILEVIRGKPISQEKEGIVHFTGFVALMILMVVVVFNDLSKLF